MDHMENALYLREEADKHLAKALIDGHRAVTMNGRSILKYLYSGIERLSWYSSCAFDEYKNVCTQLQHEDIRALENLTSLFMNRNKYILIFTLYFERLTRDLNEKDRTTLKKNLRRESLRGSIYLAGLFATANVTNRALAQGLADVIVSSPRNVDLVKRAARAGYGLTVLEHYGMLHERLKAAERLRIADPEFYWMLHKCRLETCYFFVEPILKPYIGYKGLKNEKEVRKIIMDILEKL
nr:hypothetical protein [Mixta theicola]